MCSCSQLYSILLSISEISIKKPKILAYKMKDKNSESWTQNFKKFAFYTNISFYEIIWMTYILSSKKITGLMCSRHFSKYSFWWCHVAFFMEWYFYQFYSVYLDLNLTLMFKTIQVQVWNLHQVPQHRLWWSWILKTRVNEINAINILR